MVSHFYVPHVLPDSKVDYLDKGYLAMKGGVEGPNWDQMTAEPSTASLHSNTAVMHP